MPADIVLHALGNPVHGNHPPAPSIPPLAQQVSLAENTNSNVFTVPDMGAVMCLTATTKLRVDIVTVANLASINPAGSANVLPMDIPRLFYLPKGQYQVRTTIYA